MSELGSLTFKGQEEAARKLGCRVRIPSAYELFVDIDSDQDFEVFEKHLEIFCRHFGVEGFEVAASKSGGERRHIVVRLTEAVDEKTRIAFQAFLGSDRKRELLSWVRCAKQLSVHPTVFFEKEA